jgi:hypothetical protein
MTAYAEKIVAETRAAMARQTAEREAMFDRVIAAVATAYNTTPAQILKRKQGGKINPARLVAQFLAHECGFTICEIGPKFGSSKSNSNFSIQAVVRALRMAEVIGLLRPLLHTQSSFVKGTQQNTNE